MGNLKFCIIPALATLCAVWAAPASAAIELLAPVASQDLGHFVGSTLFGAERAPLGTVTAVDQNTGTVGVVGKHGQYAVLDESVLGRDGMILHAPTVTLSQFNLASTVRLSVPGLTVTAPTIEVIEPAAPG
jgi:hypothetical protein